MTPPPPNSGSAGSDFPTHVIGMGDAALVNYRSERLRAAEGRTRKERREVGHDRLLVQPYLSRACAHNAGNIHQ